MSAVATYLLPALVPALTDGLRGLFGRLTQGKGAQPQNVAEVITLMQAQTDRLKALADLDRPAGEISRWVSNTRALFRYAAVACILLATGAAIFTGQDAAVLAVMLDMSGASMSFIIGERMYLGLKR